MNPKTMMALMRSKYAVGGGRPHYPERSDSVRCSWLFRHSKIDRTFRDGAPAPVMPPQSDTCADFMGMLSLDLNPAENLFPRKPLGK